MSNHKKILPFFICATVLSFPLEVSAGFLSSLKSAKEHANITSLPSRTVAAPAQREENYEGNFTPEALESNVRIASASGSSSVHMNEEVPLEDLKKILEQSEELTKVSQTLLQSTMQISSTEEEKANSSSSNQPVENAHVSAASPEASNDQGNTADSSKE